MKLGFVFQPPQGAWQLFIRPVRVSYEDVALGPIEIAFDDKRYVREDLEVCRPCIFGRWYLRST